MLPISFKSSLSLLTIIGTLTLANLSLHAQDELSMGARFNFLSGDSLTADIKAWDLESIKIKHPYFTGENTIDQKNILEVQLDNDVKDAPKIQGDKNITTIQIKPRYQTTTEHSTIKGNLIQNDENHILLDTAYAGKLKIKRSMIKSIKIDSASNFVYSGPNNIEEWHNTKHNESWTYKDGALYSGLNEGNIGHDTKFLDQVVLSFDHGWQEKAYLILKIFSDDHTIRNPDNYYEIRSSNGRFYITKYVNGRRTGTLNAITTDDANRLRDIYANNKNVHYDFYLNKNKGKIHIFVNGYLMYSFTDLKPTPEKMGGGLHLVSAKNFINKVSKIEVAKWSGNLPLKQDVETFADLKGSGQRIFLKNGDAIIGKTGPIKDGKMNIETEFGPIKILVNGMRSIDLSDTSDDAPIRRKGDIKLYYHDGTYIIVNPVSIAGNKLVAKHQAFGEAEFNLKSFKQIDLHVADKKYDYLRNNSNW